MATRSSEPHRGILSELVRASQSSRTLRWSSKGLRALMLSGCELRRLLNNAAVGATFGSAHRPTNITEAAAYASDVQHSSVLEDRSLGQQLRALRAHRLHRSVHLEAHVLDGSIPSEQPRGSALSGGRARRCRCRVARADDSFNVGRGGCASRHFHRSAACAGLRGRKVYKPIHLQVSRRRDDGVVLPHRRSSSHSWTLVTVPMRIAVQVKP